MLTRPQPNLPFLPDLHCRRAERRDGGDITDEDTYEDPFSPGGSGVNNQGGIHIDVEPPGTNWARRPHSIMPPEQWQRDDLIRAGAIGMLELSLSLILVFESIH